MAPAGGALYSLSSAELIMPIAFYNSGCDDDPFYLYIGGEAGTGKSFLLKLMIDAVKQLGKRSGHELEKPVGITIAPTGVAAYLVNGTTIESALGM